MVFLDSLATPEYASYTAEELADGLANAMKSEYRYDFEKGARIVEGTSEDKYEIGENLLLPLRGLYDKAIIPLRHRKTLFTFLPHTFEYTLFPPLLESIMYST